MSEIHFNGNVSSSKSIFNRALIVSSYEPDIKVLGQSDSEDVALMRKALADLENEKREFDCGHAGTTFRFFSLRLSREPGEWWLRGSPRLFSRPQEGLFKIFEQLGVKYKISDSGLFILSEGWTLPEKIVVDGEHSSQFVSALLLNSWGLPRDLRFQSALKVSEDYLNLTEKVVRYFGLKMGTEADGTRRIAAAQKPSIKTMNVEADMSSCFALAACAVLGGSTVITNFPESSWQPDSVFLEILREMGVPCMVDNGQLRVQKAVTLFPVNVDLNNSPDLFPVLAVLLAQAQGSSRITGLGHLVHKESNRLENTRLLLARLGRTLEVVSPSEVLISGRSERFLAGGDFSPDQDHRMAMAAQVANFGGAHFQILDPAVVDKSFPEFWRSVGAP